MLKTLALLLMVQTPYVPVKKLGEYRKEYKNLFQWCKKLNTYEQYSEFRLKHNKTGEIKKIEELPEFDQQFFFLTMAEKLSKKAEEVNNRWLEELGKFPPKDIIEKKEDFTDDDETIAERHYVKKFCDGMVELRKEIAKKWERQAEGIFEKYPDKFTEKEKLHYLQTMRKYNDKFIERKK